MPMADVHEHGRIGKHEQEPQAVVATDERPHRPDIERERRALPNHQRQPVRHQRERTRDEQEERRVVPAIGRGIGAEDCFRPRVLFREIERRRRLTVQRPGPGDVDIGEIRAERPALIVVEPVRGGHDKHQAQRRGRQDGEPDQADALAREPRAVRRD